MVETQLCKLLDNETRSSGVLILYFVLDFERGVCELDVRYNGYK